MKQDEQGTAAPESMAATIPVRNDDDARRIREVLKRMDEREQGELRMLAQGARAATDKDFKPRTREAFEQSQRDLEAAALRVADAERNAGGRLSDPLTTEHMARNIVEAAAGERNKAAERSGRAA